MSVTERRFDAFLSYSFAADRQLAHALQRGLHRLARAWYQARVLRVCRDLSNLPASSDLAGAIRDALVDSRWFVLLASEQSAASSWVRQEVEYWQAEREPETFLIALTSGTIVWDDEANDFDWTRTTALPRQLSGYFRAEPQWVNLGWTREVNHLSLRNDRFRSDVATLAAPVRGLPKDFLDGEDQRLHRSAVRTRRFGTSALVVLLVAVTMLAGVTWQQLTESNRQRDQALSRELAARGAELGDHDPAVAKLLSVAAWRISPTPQAKAGMLRAAARPGVAALSVNSAPVVSVAYALDGRAIAAADTDGKVRFWDTKTYQQIGPPLAAHTPDPQGMIGPVLAFSPDGATLVSSGDDGTIRLWDTASRTQLGEPLRGHTGPVYSVAFSPNGTVLASGSGDNSVRLWDIATRTQVSESFLAHRGPVRSVRFSPDGRWLATGGEDMAVRLWDVGYAADVEKSLCAMVNRTLTRAEWERLIPDAPFHQLCR
ncbi:toll/interleukin-1 receptor domain-containing protein [Saccharothrix deserti]|uniref:toll/interleukin-1 receptor domain-containing protein n=1 Tax=Saccharothrix deserti TaxID=2593674 RepID=UPI00131EAA0C|nr:TIR domain-containing protein [Saccharothrix deserti]